MNIRRILGFENKKIHDLKNQVTPELLRVQESIRKGRKDAAKTAKHMQRLEKEFTATAYTVAIATRRVE